MGIKFEKHLMGCQQKGKEAYERGENRDSCPYAVLNPWGHTGPRNLTKQRKQYWLFGYDTAEKMANE